MAKPYVLLTLEYPPQVGGVANYYSNIVGADATQSIEVITNNHNALTRPWIKIFAVLWRRQHREPIRKIIVGQILPIGTVVWLWHAVFGTPYIVYTHGMDITTPQRYRRKRWLMRHILRAAERVVTVSHYSANCLEQVLGGVIDKTVLISPAPNITPQRFPVAIAIWNKLQSQWGLRQPYILSVGRLVARKGFAEAIVAVAQLPSTYAHWHYYIVGDGPEREQLVILIESLKLNERVKLLGSLSNEAVAELYRRASFFVLPARNLATGDFEGYGTVIVEANSFGKPAIATCSGGVSDAIQPDGTGLLITPNDPTVLHEAIGRLCADAELTGRLGQAAQAWVQQHTWQTKMAQLMAWLEH